jgi:hypothetical protein
MNAPVFLEKMASIVYDDRLMSDADYQQFMLFPVFPCTPSSSTRIPWYFHVMSVAAINVAAGIGA